MRELAWRQSSSEAAIRSSGPGAASAACHVDELELLAPARAAWAARRSERSAPYTTVERTSGCGNEKRPPEIATSAASSAGLSSSRLKWADWSARAMAASFLSVTERHDEQGSARVLPERADAGKDGALRGSAGEERVAERDDPNALARREAERDFAQRERVAARDVDDLRDHGRRQLVAEAPLEEGQRRGSVEGLKLDDFGRAKRSWVAACRDEQRDPFRSDPSCDERQAPRATRRRAGARHRRKQEVGLPPPLRQATTARRRTRRIDRRARQWRDRGSPTALGEGCPVGRQSR